MNGDDLHTLCLVIEAEYAQIRDNADRAFTAQTAPLPRTGTVQKARGGNVCHTGRELAAQMAGNDNDFAGAGAHVVGAAAAGQTAHRPVIITDHGGVQIAVLVDLCGAQECHIHLAPLHITQRIEQGRGHDGGPQQRKITGALRQIVGHGINCAGFKNHLQVRSVGLLCHHGCQGGQSDADQRYIVILNDICRGTDHQFLFCPVTHHSTPCSAG